TFVTLRALPGLAASLRSCWRKRRSSAAARATRGAVTLRHNLQPLVAPSSVALVGASERPGSLGRIVYENMLAGGFRGEIFAVNPNHRQVLGHPAVRSLAALEKPVELAVIATPCEHVA